MNSRVLVVVVLSAMIVLAGGCIGGGGKQTTTPTKTQTNSQIQVDFTYNFVEESSSPGMGDYTLILTMTDTSRISKVKVYPKETVNGVGILITGPKIDGSEYKFNIKIGATKGFSGNIPLTVEIKLDTGKVITKNIQLPINIKPVRFGYLKAPFILNPINVSIGKEFTVTLTFIPYDNVEYTIDSVAFELPGWLKGDFDVKPANPKGYNIVLKLEPVSAPPESSGTFTAKVNVVVRAYDSTKTLTTTITVPYEFTQTNQTNETTNQTLKGVSVNAYVMEDDNKYSYFIVMRANNTNNSETFDEEVNEVLAYLKVDEAEVAGAYPDYDISINPDKSGAVVLVHFSLPSKVEHLTIEYPVSFEPTQYVEIPINNIEEIDKPLLITDNRLDIVMEEVEERGYIGYPTIGNAPLAGYLVAIMKMFGYGLSLMNENASITDMNVSVSPMLITPVEKSAPVMATVAIPSVNFSTTVTLSVEGYVATPGGMYAILGLDEPIKVKNSGNDLLPVYVEYSSPDGTLYYKGYADFFSLFGGDTDSEYVNEPVSAYSDETFVFAEDSVTMSVGILVLSEEKDGMLYFTDNLSKNSKTYGVTFDVFNFASDEVVKPVKIRNIDELFDVITSPQSGMLGVSIWADKNFFDYSSEPSGVIIPLFTVMLPEISSSPITDTGFTVINGSIYKFTISGAHYSLEKADGEAEFFAPQNLIEKDPFNSTNEQSSYDYHAYELLMKKPGNVNVYAVVNGSKIAFTQLDVNDVIKYIFTQTGEEENIGQVVGVYYLEPFGNYVVLNIVTSPAISSVEVNGVNYSINDDDLWVKISSADATVVGQHFLLTALVFNT